MFRKIILAFKFSSSCRSALEKAIQLSIENDAELLIFHALDYRLKEKDQRDPEFIEVNQQMKQKFETELQPYLADFPNFNFPLLRYPISPVFSFTVPAVQVLQVLHHPWQKI